MCFDPLDSILLLTKTIVCFSVQTLKDEAVLAAMDLNRYENERVQSRFNITGFPTTLYFEYVFCGDIY